MIVQAYLLRWLIGTSKSREMVALPASIVAREAIVFAVPMNVYCKVSQPSYRGLLKLEVGFGSQEFTQEDEKNIRREAHGDQALPSLCRQA